MVKFSHEKTFRDRGSGFMKKENICEECGEEKEIETYILEKYGFRVCEACLVVNSNKI